MAADGHPVITDGRDDDVAGAPGASRRLVALGILEDEVAEIVEDWQELCRWDPMLPPDAPPPIASAVVQAVASALSRPQPLGWGPDPEIEKVTEVFATSVESIDVAIGQLVCLREAIRRRTAGRVPADETVETGDRLGMVLDRAIGVAAATSAARLQRDAFVEPLTGLLNRRALERDVRREIARAERYSRRFGLMILDVDGLKAVNDAQGHATGDAMLQALSGAVLDAIGDGGDAYRVGGDEFIVLLPEVAAHSAEALAMRIVAGGGPSFSWGVAAYPDDGTDLGALIDAADRRMLDRKRDSAASA